MDTHYAVPLFFINTILKNALTELFAAIPMAEAPIQFFSATAIGYVKS
jgi:hypothetical protein